MNKMERNKKEVVDVINDLNHIYPIWLRNVGKYDKTARRIENSVKILESELKDVARLVTQSNCSSKFTINGQLVTNEKKTKAFSTYIPKGFDVFALAHLKNTGSLNRYLKRNKRVYLTDQISVDVINDINDFYQIWLKDNDSDVIIDDCIKVYKSKLKPINNLIVKTDCYTKFSPSGTIILSDNKTRSSTRYIPKGFDVAAMKYLKKTGSLKSYLIVKEGMSE